MEPESRRRLELVESLQLVRTKPDVVLAAVRLGLFWSVVPTDLSPLIVERREPKEEHRAVFGEDRGEVLLSFD